MSGGTQNRRVRRQTVFYKGDEDSKKEQPKQKRKISVDVGIIPQNLKSIIKNRSTAISANKRLSTQIIKKYRRKPLMFNDKFSIRLVSPLPGWRSDFVRMPDSDTESDEEFGNTILQKVCLTPESAKLISTCSLEVEDSIVKFNATFNSEELPSKEVINEKKKRSRRKSIIRMKEEDQSETLQQNVQETTLDSVPIQEENISNSVDEGKKNRRKSRRSIIVTEMEKSARPSKRRQSTAFLALDSAKEEINNSGSQIPSKYKSLCEKSANKRRTVRQERLFTWLNNERTEPKSSMEKENLNNSSNDRADDLIFVENAATSSITKRKIKPTRTRKNSAKIASKDLEEARRTSPTNGEPSMPDIIEIVEVARSTSEKEKIRITKKRNPSKDVKSNEKLSETKIILNDCAPLHLLHVIEPIQIADESDWKLEMIAEGKRDVLVPQHSFPKSSCPALDGIKLCKVSPEEKSVIFNSFDLQERTWINSFIKCDLTGNWTDSLCPKLSTSWLGDQTIAEKARDHIAKWKRRVSKDTQDSKKPSKKGKSKYEDDDFDYIDDEDCSLANPLILCGPSGSGKTSLIASLTAEFNMNIIEIQPGDKRNSTALKQKFDGALKSHMMNKNRISIFSFFGSKDTKTEAIPKSQNNQQNLLVVEHVDLVFEEDKDFWPTLKNMALEARVPMIWTCENVPIEITKEPSLESYELLNIDGCPASLLARFIRCLLLTVKNVTAPFSDLEKYVNALGCDQRKILFDLQLQTADGDNNFLQLPSHSNINAVPLKSDKNTTYENVQELRENKKIQYSNILDELEINTKHKEPSHIFIQSAQALRYRLPQKFLAIDYLPYLVEMDKMESNKKAQKKRRHLHYFHEVRTEGDCIDSTGNLLSIVRESSLLVNANITGL